MANGECYGWEEVYEAYGCSPSYAAPRPTEGTAPLRDLVANPTDRETGGDVTDDLTVVQPAVVTITTTLIPSPG